MDLHKNARSCPKSRALLVKRVLEEGWTVRKAAEAQGLSARSGYRWLRRYRSEGSQGLQDRSSCPHQSPRRLGKKDRERILSLRLERLSQAEIAWKTGIPRSTVSRWLRRWDLGRLPQLAPPEPVRRYEKQHAGELVHLDIKKLGKIRSVGHRITGDYRGAVRVPAGSLPTWPSMTTRGWPTWRSSRMSARPAPKPFSSGSWLSSPIEAFTIQRILTDNGACYVA